MLNIQPLTNFEGFGTGPGEYFHSQGMIRSKNGIVPGWKVTAAIDDSSLAGLALMNWLTWSQGAAANPYVFGIQADGKIYRSQNGTGMWELAYTPFFTSHGNGLFGAPDGNLYFLSQDYLGYYNGGDNYSDGTVAVTNGSPNVVGTGTVWGTGVVGKKITIDGVDYFILSRTDNTHITLTTNYAGTTASGLSYTIFGNWVEHYQAITSHLSSTSDLRGVDCYEDLIIFSNGYTFGTFNMTSLTLASDAFTLPLNFKTLIARPGRTGVLCTAIVGNRSIAFLWDGNSDRSIAPWIWFNETIKSVVTLNNGNWLIITNKRIYISDGYSAQVFLPHFPDDKVNTSSITANILPGGADVMDNKLVFIGTTEGLNRQKSGVYVLDLDTKLFNFAPVANGQLINIQAGAVFFDRNYRMHLSYKTTGPNKTVLGYLSNSVPSTSFVIQEAGTGNNKKVAEGVNLNLNLDTKEIDRGPITFDVSVKVANLKQLVYGYGLTNSISATLNTLKVDGTSTGLNNAEVGDEVTILEGLNAGQIRHITAIANQNTTTETWTLDSNLPNLTENTIRLNVSPFKLTKKSTFSSAAKLRDLYFPITKQLQGKKFLIKTVFENVSGNVPELTESDFIYDDLGQL